MKKLLLASTSTVYGGTYLSYLQDELINFFEGINQIIFIPYARPSGISHDEYTAIAHKAFKAIGKEIIGLHTFANPAETLRNAQAIFTGGGNTFLLVTQLYQQQLIAPLREAVLNGCPYMGSSAGTNIAGVTMQTTNDMPIIYPPSFNTLGLVPFNINPHYIDPDPHSKHQGETRETRIKEFLNFNNIPVVGLREGSWIRVEGETISLRGELTARIFTPNTAPYESHEIKF
ncbi:dipeptidase PepE [Capnocytophaga bilenii]